ncbi:MAG: EAL domain-containing protein [Xanthomonadales bacterium]|nr:EAL domain-containing protein [Xanthomonadales bacterium]
MAATSDIQQTREAQLKQAFHKHLPRRIGSLQRRLKALVEGGWDINTLHLTHAEIQQLAGSSGKYGMVEASEKLYSLEVFLSKLLQSAQPPDEGQTDEIFRLVTELDSISGGSDLEDIDIEADRVVAKIIATASLPEPEIGPGGLPSPDNVPHFIQPPAEFLPFDPGSGKVFHRVADDVAEPDFGDTGYSDHEIHRLAEENLDLEIGDIQDHLVSGDAQYHVEESEDVGESWKEDLRKGSSRAIEVPDNLPEPGQAVDAAPEVPRLPTLYYLHMGSNSNRELAETLQQDYELSSFDNVDEFKDMLSAMGPDAILIDGEFIDEIENLGALVKKIRAKQNRPMPMVAFSNATDVSQRLKILRAGADAFLKNDASIREVQRRLADLLQVPENDPYRILIVEDDRTQAVFAESILRKAGMEVRLERDPLKALDHLEQFNPELILMDLYMPHCDGMELTALIREREEFINTPIVFLSGESDTDKHFDALLAGGDDFLSKPIRPRHLISAVTNRVSRARILALRQQQTTSVTDTVTGLAERPELLETVNAILTDLDQSDPDRPGGILYLEIDRPFDIRQRLGLGGFETLADQLAPLITANLAEQDLASRYGDTSYCVMLPNRTLDLLSSTATQIQERIAGHLFQVGDATTSATVSIGVCQFSSQLADAGAMISAAERACNVSYSDEVNRINVQDLGTDFDKETDEALATLIEEAIDQDDLQVVFQPIVSLHGEQGERYQALVRLTGEDGRPVPARRLIPVAEQHGLVARLDRWMLNRALTVLDERQRLARPIRLFVNLSRHTLGDKDLLPRLYKQLQRRSVRPECLVLEFKLPEIVNRLKAAVAYVGKIRELGVLVCLGGFDGDSAAFQCLEHLPVDYVKLPAADRDHADQALGKSVASITDKLHGMGKLVIIPAIEDAKTAAKLWSTGVDYIQGNFVQPPEQELMYQFSDSHM